MINPKLINFMEVNFNLAKNRNEKKPKQKKKAKEKTVQINELD